MSFLRTEKIWNGNVQEYQFWFSCDNCEKPIFEGDAHWSNSEVPEEERGYVGPTVMPPQKEIDRVLGTEHYCPECAYKLGIVSKWEYIKASGCDPAETDVIEEEDGKLVLVVSTRETSKRPQKKRAASPSSQNRQAISKTMRFDVFKKCNFRCHYCGVSASDAHLEIDHITPVSKGGTNAFDNLVVACFDCNRGKRDKELD